jgi:hypothetical protein
MPSRTRISRASLLLLAAAALVPTLTAAHAQARTRASQEAVKLPTPAAATAIVRNLWDQREAVLTLLDPGMLGPYESASALEQDSSYIGFVLCKCTQPKDAHPADRVVPLIPRTSVQAAFLAQVHTTNTTTHAHPWYIVAVEQDRSGHWKLAFVTYAGTKATPPLFPLVRSSGYAPGVDGSAYARVARLARSYARADATHRKSVFHTSYGATVHVRTSVEGRRSGIYGLILPSGNVLSCFSLHGVETYTLAGGLQQNAARKQWGYQLAPGAYRSVIIDQATPSCVVGKGVDSNPGVLHFEYDQQIVSTTGVRMP